MRHVRHAREVRFSLFKLPLTSSASEWLSASILPEKLCASHKTCRYRITVVGMSPTLAFSHTIADGCRRVQRARRRASCDEAAAPLQAATEHGKLPRRPCLAGGRALLRGLATAYLLLVAPHKIVRKEIGWFAWQFYVERSSALDGAINISAQQFTVTIQHWIDRRPHTW